MRILYVEDNEDNIYMLERRLKRAGFDSADRHATARRAWRWRQPNCLTLILMDMSLPGARRLRRRRAGSRPTPETKHIPVIALTANAMTGDREKALAAGCDDFDTKPVELPRLLGKIQALAPAASGGQTA